MEIWDCFYSAVIVFNIIFFIRRVQIIIIQSKPHKNYLNSEFSFKYGANWDAASATNRDWSFAKRFFHCFGSGLLPHANEGSYVGFAAMMFKRCYGNSRGSH